MHRIFLIFTLFLTFIMQGIVGVYASCETQGSMNTSEFMIDVSCMDPMSDNHANSASGGGMSILTSVIGRLADFLLFLVPVIAAVSFIIAGYYYIFSVGDSEKVNKAKTIIKWNILAITVALLSYGIVQLVANFFS